MIWLDNFTIKPKIRACLVVDVKHHGVVVWLDLLCLPHLRVSESVGVLSFHYRSQKYQHSMKKVCILVNCSNSQYHVYIHN